MAASDAISSFRVTTAVAHMDTDQNTFLHKNHKNYYRKSAITDNVYDKIMALVNDKKANVSIS